MMRLVHAAGISLLIALMGVLPHVALGFMTPAGFSQVCTRSSVLCRDKSGVSLNQGVKNGPKNQEKNGGNRQQKNLRKVEKGQTAGTVPPRPASSVSAIGGSSFGSFVGSLSDGSNGAVVNMPTEHAPQWKTTASVPATPVQPTTIRAPADRAASRASDTTQSSSRTPPPPSTDEQAVETTSFAPVDFGSYVDEIFSASTGAPRKIERKTIVSSGEESSSPGSVSSAGGKTRKSSAPAASEPSTPADIMSLLSQIGGGQAADCPASAPSNFGSIVDNLNGAATGAPRAFKNQPKVSSPAPYSGGGSYPGGRSSSAGYAAQGSPGPRAAPQPAAPAPSTSSHMSGGQAADYPASAPSSFGSIVDDLNSAATGAPPSFKSKLQVSNPAPSGGGSYPGGTSSKEDYSTTSSPRAVPQPASPGDVMSLLSQIGGGQAADCPASAPSNFGSIVDNLNGAATGAPRAFKNQPRVSSPASYGGGGSYPGGTSSSAGYAAQGSPGPRAAPQPAAPAPAESISTSSHMGGGQAADYPASAPSSFGSIVDDLNSAATGAPPSFKSELQVSNPTPSGGGSYPGGTSSNTGYTTHSSPPPRAAPQPASPAESMSSYHGMGGGQAADYPASAPSSFGSIVDNLNGAATGAPPSFKSKLQVSNPASYGGGGSYPGGTSSSVGDAAQGKSGPRAAPQPPAPAPAPAENMSTNRQMRGEQAAAYPSSAPSSFGSVVDDLNGAATGAPRAFKNQPQVISPAPYGGGGSYPGGTSSSKGHAAHSTPRAAPKPPEPTAMTSYDQMGGGQTADYPSSAPSSFGSIVDDLNSAATGAPPSFKSKPQGSSPAPYGGGRSYPGATSSNAGYTTQGRLSAAPRPEPLENASFEKRRTPSMEQGMQNRKSSQSSMSVEDDLFPTSTGPRRIGNVRKRANGQTFGRNSFLRDTGNTRSSSLGASSSSATTPAGVSLSATNTPSETALSSTPRDGSGAGSYLDNLSPSGSSSPRKITSQPPWGEKPKADAGTGGQSYLESMSSTIRKSATESSPPKSSSRPGSNTGSYLDNLTTLSTVSREATTRVPSASQNIGTNGQSYSGNVSSGSSSTLSKPLRGPAPKLGGAASGMTSEQRRPLSQANPSTRGLSLEEKISASFSSARNVGSDSSSYVSTRESLRESKARTQRRLSRSAYEKEKAAEEIAKLKAKMEAETKQVQQALEEKLDQNQALIDTEVERMFGLLRAEIDLESQREALVMGLVDCLEDSRATVQQDIERDAAIAEEMIEVRSKQREGKLARQLDTLIAQKTELTVVELEILKDLEEGLAELRAVLNDGRERRARAEGTIRTIRRPETRADSCYEWSDIEEMEAVLERAADVSAGVATRIRNLSRKVDEALVRKSNILGEPIPARLESVVRNAVAAEAAREVFSPSKRVKDTNKTTDELRNKETVNLMGSFAGSFGKSLVSASKLGFFGVQALVDSAKQGSPSEMDNNVVDKSSGFSTRMQSGSTAGSTDNLVKSERPLDKAKKFLGNFGKSEYKNKAGEALRETSEELLAALNAMAALTAQVVDVGLKKVEDVGEKILEKDRSDRTLKSTRGGWKNPFRTDKE